MKNLKPLLNRYRHAWVLLYLLIYMPAFMYLERTVTTHYKVIHTRLDDMIPFLEIFAIPYFLWFAYIAIVIAYFFLKDRREFYQCTAFLFIGMTFCLMIYAIWPNGHDLRPDLDSLGRDNIFLRSISRLYATDTNTNVCPSIHAFNSIGAYIAIRRSRHLQGRRFLRAGALTLTVLICMSTVFLKQHSIFDVMCACILAAVMYLAIYVPNHEKVSVKHRIETGTDAALIDK